MQRDCKAEPMPQCQDVRFVGHKAPRFGPVGVKFARTGVSGKRCSSMDPMVHQLVQPRQKKDFQNRLSGNRREQMTSSVMNKSCLHCKLLLDGVVRETIQVLRGTNSFWARTSESGETVFAAIRSRRAAPTKPLSQRRLIEWKTSSSKMSQP